MSLSTFILSYEKPTVNENTNKINAIDVNIARAIDKAYNKQFQVDALNTIFAEWVRQNNKQ